MGEIIESSNSSFRDHINDADGIRSIPPESFCHLLIEF